MEGDDQSRLYNRLDWILALIAVGWHGLMDKLDRGRIEDQPEPLGSIIPKALSQGMAGLHAYVLVRRRTSEIKWPQEVPQGPVDMRTMQALLELPLQEWPLDFNEQGLEDLDTEHRLLDQDDDGLISRLQDGLPDRRHVDLLTELEQLQVKMVRDACRGRGNEGQRDYVRFRRYLIENPVTTQDDIDDFVLKFFDLNNLPRTLNELYRPAPESAWNRDGRLPICRYCGWTLNEVGTDLRCVFSVCNERYQRDGEVSQAEIAQWPQTPSRPWMRLIYGVQRYTALPGRPELGLHTQLKNLGLAPQLWPEFDICDLSVKLPGGYLWAVDVKDWAKPEKLANSAGQDNRSHETLGADKLWIVVPDYRLKARPDSMKVFHQRQQPFHWNGGKETEYEVAIVSQSEFIKKVQEEMGRSA